MVAGNEQTQRPLDLDAGQSSNLSSRFQRPFSIATELSVTPPWSPSLPPTQLLAMSLTSWVTWTIQLLLRSTII